MMLILISLVRADCISPEIFLASQGTNVLLALVPPLRCVNFRIGVVGGNTRPPCGHDFGCADIIISAQRLPHSTFWAVFISKTS